MCHQTVGLVQAEIERRGIVTASVTLMPEITATVGVTRALEVSFALGCPFGEAGDREMHVAVLRALLALCEAREVPVREVFGSPRDAHPTTR
jgi:hypothetical protein